MQFSKAIITSHCFVPITEIPNLRDMRERFTVKSKFDGDRAIPIFREVGKWFGFPLQVHYDQYAEEVEDHRVWGEEIKVGLRSTLYPQQKEVFDNFVQALAQGKTNFVLEAKAGWGKTFWLICAIAHVGRTCLVVVPKSDLVEQWKDRILTHTFLTSKDIGVVEGRNASWEGKKIVIALVHSLGLNYLPQEFRKYFGQTWFDEVHSSTPPGTFAPVLQAVPSVIRGGASATLIRQDGLHKVYEQHIGECYLSGRDGNRMTPKVFSLFYEESSGYIPAYEKMQRRGIIISKLAGNSHRNHILAKRIHALYLEDYRVLVISDRTEQLLKINAIMTGHYGIPQSHLGYYCKSLSNGDGSRTVKTSEIRHAREEARIINATYGYMKMGTDIPDLSALVPGTPQTDPRQTKGRIERFLPGKKQPIVIDLVDTAYKETIGWYAARQKFYNKEGLQIIRTAVK